MKNIFDFLLNFFFSSWISLWQSLSFVWRSIKKIFLFTSVFLFSISCSKNEKGDEGSILVTVKHDGKAVPQASVYIKYGTTTDPNIPLSQYDKVMGADAVGQVYFEKLIPQGYFIHATGHDQGKTVNGDNSVTIRSRYRQNSYDVTVETQ